jgi:hypothetical protein
VGDIVDRGPRIREALHTVFDMVDSGNAQMVMGNHEYNALCYETKQASTLAQGQTRYLREHNARHTSQISATLDQFSAYPGDWKDFLSWFIELPLFLEYPDFRVVHACWDHELIEQFLATQGGNQIDAHFLQNSVKKGCFEAKVLDRLTRGIDLKLPDDRSILSKDGFLRRFFRVSFWHDKPETYGEVAFQPDPLPEDLAEQSISELDREKMVHYGHNEKPLFIGHYWRTGLPKVLKSNLACLDYSAVKEGKLVAYRMTGERTLCNDHFVWVSADRELAQLRP